MIREVEPPDRGPDGQPRVYVAASDLRKGDLIFESIGGKIVLTLVHSVRIEGRIVLAVQLCPENYPGQDAGGSRTVEHAFSSRRVLPVFRWEQ